MTSKQSQQQRASLTTPTSAAASRKKDTSRRARDDQKAGDNDEVRSPELYSDHEGELVSMEKPKKPSGRKSPMEVTPDSAGTSEEAVAPSPHSTTAISERLNRSGKTPARKEAKQTPIVRTPKTRIGNTNLYFVDSLAESGDSDDVSELRGSDSEDGPAVRRSSRSRSGSPDNNKLHSSSEDSMPLLRQIQTRNLKDAVAKAQEGEREEDSDPSQREQSAVQSPKLKNQKVTRRNPARDSPNRKHRKQGTTQAVDLSLQSKALTQTPRTRDESPVRRSPRRNECLTDGASIVQQKERSKPAPRKPTRAVNEQKQRDTSDSDLEVIAFVEGDGVVETDAASSETGDSQVADVAESSDDEFFDAQEDLFDSRESDTVGTSANVKKYPTNHSVSVTSGAEARGAVKLRRVLITRRDGISKIERSKPEVRPGAERADASTKNEADVFSFDSLLSTEGSARGGDSSTTDRKSGGRRRTAGDVPVQRRINGKKTQSPQKETSQRTTSGNFTVSRKDESSSGTRKTVARDAPIARTVKNSDKVKNDRKLPSKEGAGNFEQPVALRRTKRKLKDSPLLREINSPDGLFAAIPLDVTDDDTPVFARVKNRRVIESSDEGSDLERTPLVGRRPAQSPLIREESGPSRNKRPKIDGNQVSRAKPSQSRRRKKGEEARQADDDCLSEGPQEDSEESFEQFMTPAQRVDAEIVMNYRNFSSPVKVDREVTLNLGKGSPRAMLRAEANLSPTQSDGSPRKKFSEIEHLMKHTPHGKYGRWQKPGAKLYKMPSPPGVLGEGGSQSVSPPKVRARTSSPKPGKFSERTEKPPLQTRRNLHGRLSGSHDRSTSGDSSFGDSPDHISISQRGRIIKKKTPHDR